MDQSQFDRLAKAVVSRRNGLGAGLATLLGFAAVDASAKRKKKKPKKCKPACGTCQKCEKGKCKPQSNGTACGSGDTCQGGACSGDGGCGAGQKRCGSACIARNACCQDDETCNGDGRCLTGVCRAKPVCEPNGTVIPQASANGRTCCSSNVSCQAGTTQVECTCLPASPGDTCRSDSDCATGTCVGYRCRSCSGAACGPTYRFELSITGSGLSQLQDPNEITVNHAGNVLVVEWDTHRVLEFTPSGGFVRQLGVTGVPGADSQHFHFPDAVAVDKDDNIYVADSVNNRVQKFSPTGAWLHTWGVTGVRGTDNDHLDYPSGVAVDSRNVLYIGDYDNARVQVFQTNGTYVRSIRRSGLSEVQSIALDQDDNLYAKYGPFWEFDENGTFLQKQGTYDFYNPIAFGPDGSIFVVLAWGDGHTVVHQYTSSWTFVRQFDPSTEPGARPTQFTGAQGVALDSAGNLYISGGGGYDLPGGGYVSTPRILKYTIVTRTASAAGRSGSARKSNAKRHRRPG